MIRFVPPMISRSHSVVCALGALASWGCGDDSGAGGGTTSGETAQSATSTSVVGSSANSASSSSATTGGFHCEPPAAGMETLALVPFVTGIEQPIVMATDPADPGRLYVGGRTGIVRVVQDGQLLPEPFLDVSADVSCCDDDRGFLGLVMHPDYARNGLFYVHYTRLGTVADSTTVLAEYQRSAGDPMVADPTPVREIMTLDQTVVWHYGGTITFGPDGLLYYVRGDGGGAGDPEGDAQNPMNRYGKVLRIDVDAFPTPPPGNMPNADPFVWDIGLRNPWRASFDVCTGDLYIGDVGQNQVEEVSVHGAGASHQNFGWNQYEGDLCYNLPCVPDGLTFPAVSHLHVDGWCAVVGGYVYRGALLTGHRGRYFYGDICSKRILSFELGGDGLAANGIDHSVDLDTSSLLGDYGFGSFGQDLFGELYVLDMTGGAVFRIEPD